MFQTTKYALDLVLCIDATSDMQCIIEPLKTFVPRFYQKLRDKMTDRGKEIDQRRVKVIAFRDYWQDAADIGENAELGQNSTLRLKASQKKAFKEVS